MADKKSYNKVKNYDSKKKPRIKLSDKSVRKKPYKGMAIDYKPTEDEYGSDNFHH